MENAPENERRDLVLRRMLNTPPSAKGALYKKASAKAKKSGGKLGIRHRSRSMSKSTSSSDEQA